MGKYTTEVSAVTPRRPLHPGLELKKIGDEFEAAGKTRENKEVRGVKNTWAKAAYETAKGVGYRFLKGSPLLALVAPGPITYGLATIGTAINLYEARSGDKTDLLMAGLSLVAAGKSFGVAAAAPNVVVSRPDVNNQVTVQSYCNGRSFNWGKVPCDRQIAFGVRDDINLIVGTCDTTSLPRPSAYRCATDLASPLRTAPYCFTPSPNAGIFPSVNSPGASAPYSPNPQISDCLNYLPGASGTDLYGSADYDVFAPYCKPVKEACHPGSTTTAPIPKTTAITTEAPTTVPETSNSGGIAGGVIGATAVGTAIGAAIGVKVGKDKCKKQRLTFNDAPSVIEAPTSSPV